MKKFLHSGFIIGTFMSSAVAQVPLLNSNPSASAVVFLDFDGHTVTGTSWNYNGPIVCGASGLNNTQITEVFNRIAEDYRPFMVNVTTDSTKYLAAPLIKRIRVIVTITSEWYGSSGGVAFIGSFIWGDDTPCFVFSAILNYNVKNISEAASHEAGHTLGLYHQSRYDADCNKLSDYHSGAGSGEIGWAPIMGSGYYQNFTLWNNGPNSYGCNNLQSDLDIITTGNGFFYRNDDHSERFNQATNVNFINNQFILTGIVERSTDLDMIKFQLPASGRLVLNAIPYNVGLDNAGSNLDLQVTLFSHSKKQLNIYNPGLLLSSFADTVLNQGIYYLGIEGKGNIYTSNYASLGSYSLQGNFSANSSAPFRKLELNGELSGDKHKLDWAIDADGQVMQQTLEIATDGRNFNPIPQPAATDRQFIYRPVVTSTAQYRLKVIFGNGQQHYSNIITLRQGLDAGPKLVSNLVHTNTITVISEAVYTYFIYDFNGKTVAGGQVKNGITSISAQGISNTGMYIIRFDNGKEAWVEKFMRQ